MALLSAFIAVKFLFAYVSAFFPQNNGYPVDKPLIRALFRVPASACSITAAVTAVVGV